MPNVQLQEGPDKGAQDKLWLFSLPFWTKRPHLINLLWSAEHATCVSSLDNANECIH